MLKAFSAADQGLLVFGEYGLGLGVEVVGWGRWVVGAELLNIVGDFAFVFFE